MFAATLSSKCMFICSCSWIYKQINTDHNYMMCVCVCSLFVRLWTSNNYLLLLSAFLFFVYFGFVFSLRIIAILYSISVSQLTFCEWRLIILMALTDWRTVAVVPHLLNIACQQTEESPKQLRFSFVWCSVFVTSALFYLRISITLPQTKITMHENNVISGIMPE